MQVKNWETYRSEFIEEAQRKNVSVRKIELWIQYAQTLYEKNLPVIYNLEHLSLLLGYKIMYLDRAITSTENFYRYYRIPKKNSGFREIREPLPSLKEIQQWILQNILYRLECSPYAKAYKNGSSIKENARFHKNQSVVLSLDLKDYFPSITIEKVIAFFGSLGYTSLVTDYLAKICCLDNCLPQGSPTSPYLSNLITSNIDSELGKLAQAHNLRYTRYADDITFSGDFHPGIIIKKVSRIIEDNDLQINHEKIRAKERHEQQLVTGIIVNNRKLNVPKAKRKELRQHVYYIQKFGLEAHMIHRKITKRNFLRHLIGLANHILHINPKDKDVRYYKAYLFDLLNQYSDEI